jgi:hypothetical protein
VRLASFSLELDQAGHWNAFTVDAAATTGGPGAAILPGPGLSPFPDRADRPISMDDTSSIDKLTEYGRSSGQKILNDQ